jgi:hypothetical protein
MFITIMFAVAAGILLYKWLEDFFWGEHADLDRLIKDSDKVQAKLKKANEEYDAAIIKLGYGGAYKSLGSYESYIEKKTSNDPFIYCE